MIDGRDHLPEQIYDADQSGALDARFIREFGVEGFELMQRASAAAYAALECLQQSPGRVCVLCGPGNNGGDGFLIARHALEAGWQVQLLALADPDRIRGDAARAAAAFTDAGGETALFEDRPIEADVVVDALLGTGLNRDVEGRFAAAIVRINAAARGGAAVLAVDIPSGIDASTGRIWAVAVQADITATFISMKLGLLTGAGPSHCGDIVFDALCAPARLYHEQPFAARRLTQNELHAALAPRPRSAHKGDNGHVLCIGGNQGMGGSIRMSAEGALRSGAGLVSVVCHPDHAGAMSQARPELMCRGVRAGDSIATLVDAADVVAIGPGLGSDEWAQSLWHTAIESDKPLVVDADALNRLAVKPQARGNWILTPHPGEAGRLLEWSTKQVINDRPGAVAALAKRYDATVVVKGAGSLVATGQGLAVCTAGNPGMAVGGMGDLLTGVIAALRGQGLANAQAADCGVFVHACAADKAAAQDGERGLLPSDLLGPIRQVVNPARS